MFVYPIMCFKFIRKVCGLKAAFITCITNTSLLLYLRLLHIGFLLSEDLFATIVFSSFLKLQT